MTRKIAIAGLLMASVFAAPSFATDVKTGAGANVDASTTASTAAKASFGTVMSSIKAGKSNAASIQSLTDVNTVNVVRVGDLANGNNMQALDKAVVDAKADIDGLHTAIDANAALKAKLDAQSVTTSSIVATTVESDGSLTVYVK